MIEVTTTTHEVFGTTSRYYKDTMLHRSNGPAITWDDDGEWSWALYDLMHRYYGPVDNVHGRWVVHGKAVR